MGQESDDLWKYVHRIVHDRVPPEHREAVTDLVAKTTVHILTTPEFLYGLRLVRELQFENEQLRRVIVSLQAARAPATRPRKKAAAKKAAPRKAAAKKNPAAKKVPTKNTRAFKRGATGR
jgi:hypothetical protein